MEYTIEFDPSVSFATITGSGEPTFAGFVGYLTELVENPAWTPEMPALVDHRKLHIDLLTSDQVREVVNLHKPFAERIGNGRIAVVVSRPVDFGLVRMFETIADEMFPQFRVFYTIEESMDWLGVKTG